MENSIKTTLRDSAAARWTALVLLASAMFFGYIFMDVLSPLKDLLQEHHGWDSAAFGRFAGSETFLNVFVFFLILAGIILDKMGVRFTAVLSGSVMLIGGAINYYAVTDAFQQNAGLVAFMDNFCNLPDSAWNITPFYKGMPASAKLSAIGFMLFGCGVEMAGITVSRGIAKWFKGKEMALAMGIEMAIARVGVAVVMVGSPAIAKLGGAVSVSRPVAFSVLLMLIGLICFICYGVLDYRLEKQEGNTEEKDDPFKVSDLKYIVTSKVFWLIALLCVLYYSAIFPFQKYAVNMLQCNLGFTAEQAGLVFSVFPLGAAAITPFLGNYLDTKGKGATMLIFGALLMIVCHLSFAFLVPMTQNTVLTIASIVLLGISFSLVPASLWPSVPKIVDEKLLGSAYALIFWIQNIGLYAFPMIIGGVLTAVNPGVEDPTKLNYTVPMCIFAALGVLALIFGLMLKAEDKKKGYGLELPNKKK